MAGSTRGEFASNSLDGTTFSTAYQNGQRGAYSASCLDRSGSFRENSEPRIMVSGPGTSRSSVSSLELPSMAQFLPLEPFSMSEQKYSRSGELRRVLGVTVEEHAFGSVQSKPLPSISSEDLRRFKGSVFESSIRARDRAKSLQDLIQKLDKYRNMLSRKRQRTDILSEKSGSSNMSKVGNQSHQNPTELVGQRLEDRTKNVVPNKRARSSIVEARSEGRGIVAMRQGTVMEKEKNMHFDKDKGVIRGCNGGLMPADDKMRGLPPGGDGWEKKLKRKRSVGTMVNRVMEGDREIKQTIQQRPGNEPRQRSSDGNGFRPGSSSSIVASSKTEGSSQLSGGNSRIIPRNELDICSAPNEKRERSVVLDKERVLPKGANKLGIREDAQPGTQSPLPKGKASRAPRTGSGVLMSTSLPRTSGGFDGWEQSANLNKVHSLNGPTNRKRPLPTGSSSPPVTQWVGQRPQKMSRARRANVVSPVSNLDDSQFLPEGFATPEIGSRLTAMDAGAVLLPNRGISNLALQSKVKLDSVSSPAGFSECEESGAVDNKFKEKGSDNAELEDVTPNAYHKPATFILPTKKNKAQLKEEIGDGVRRQGRSGRTSVLSKACIPLSKEKNEISESTKPTKSGKLSSDKNESRIGRPPLKKMSDRKVYARPGQLVNSGSSDIAGESDDDHEELLAAANAAHTSIYNACSSSFWKNLQPFFAFVTSEDISFLKNQIHFVEELDAVLSDKILDGHDALGEMPWEVISSTLSSFPIVQSQSMSGPNKSFDNAYSTDGSQNTKTEAGNLQGPIEKTIPLSQILLSAFITEDEIENLDYSAEGGEAFSQYPNDFFHDTNVPLQNEQMDFMKSEFKIEFDYKNHNDHLGDNIPSNGYMSPSNFRRSNVQSFVSGDEALAEGSVPLHSNNGSFPEYRQNDLPQSQNVDCNSSDDWQFDCMPLNDRLLMELHSIGLHPEAVTELDDDYEGQDELIDKGISELKMQLYHQVKTNKIQLQKLEKATQSAQENEERTLEKLAVNNLVDMAYKRLTGGRVGSSHKSGVSKVQKRLALAFAKRTLARCQKFEDTGKSCFSEPALRDALLAGPVQSIDTKLAYGTMPSAEERHVLSSKIDRGPSDSYQGFAQTPDQSANRGKKKEVLLDDVVISASRPLSNTTQSGPKWKKADRERDQSRESSARNPSAKTGRPSLSNGRGERKTKTKPKQKIAQLSASGNGVGRVTEAANFIPPSIRDSCETASNPINQELELQSSSNVANDSFKEIDDLPLHGIDSIDELDVTEGLGGQGQDIGSWLNVDEDALLDHDLVGLEIPMDDLSDLKLNF